MFTYRAGLAYTFHFWGYQVTIGKLLTHASNCMISGEVFYPNSLLLSALSLILSHSAGAVPLDCQVAETKTEAQLLTRLTSKP